MPALMKARPLRTMNVPTEEHKRPESRAAKRP